MKLCYLPGPPCHPKSRMNPPPGEKVARGGKRRGMPAGLRAQPLLGDGASSAVCCTQGVAGGLSSGRTWGQLILFLGPRELVHQEPIPSVTEALVSCWLLTSLSSGLSRSPHPRICVGPQPAGAWQEPCGGDLPHPCRAVTLRPCLCCPYLPSSDCTW